MKSYDNTEVTYSPEETRFAIAEDSCSVSLVFRSLFLTEILGQELRWSGHR